jgi:glucosylceramidase
LIGCVLLTAATSFAGPGPAADVAPYVSTLDLSRRLAPLPAIHWSDDDAGPDERAVVDVDPSRRFQTLLGMGSSLEPTTCFNISQLPPEKQDEVVERLVDPACGVGMNLMRVCIGTPDFTGDPWYTYNDLPEGGEDPELTRFSIERDERYILPVLRKFARKRPDLLWFASPWSPPGWMTTTGDEIGGELKREWYDAYARYFVKFVQAYRDAGVPMYAVTVQNEPGVDRNLEKDEKWRYPSCRWTAQQERDFIRGHLGPAFERAGLDVKIWCYDHNYNLGPTPDGDDPGLDYPRTILKDPQAARYVAGVAFHGYAGKPANMSLFHQEFPDLPIHFTEGSVFGLAGAVRLVALLRNWAVSYNAWVTMTDTDGGPNNGPFPADTTCIQRDPRTNDVLYHFDYYMLGQFMRFAPRGAVRIGSDCPRFANVAFQRPDGSVALVVVNPLGRERPLQIRCAGRTARDVLAPSSVTTFVWTP